jgi:isoleucyl-tRNA synthetase
MTVGDWVGVYLRDASPLVAEDMNKKGNLLRSEIYTHRLPFYRGKNPLIYMAQDSYFIDVQSIKEKMLELNENVNWYPEHHKHKRVADTIKTSPDWAVSRNRYWATIMPIWRSENGEEMVVGSFEEMMQYTDQIEKKVEDGRDVYYLDGKKLHLHRDMCDKLVFKKDGKEFKRIPEVLDCWMDSGSVPFAEYHYPFENKEKFENGFPADFIVEYSAQIRAWFNVLFRISTILFEREPYKNVLCHGVLSGNDGRKMSKSFNNYTDPKKVLETIGGEAIRLYFMSTPLMSGGDAEWSDELLAEQVKNIMIPLWN